MFRKILIGMLGVLFAFGLAAAGYRLGQHLAQNDNDASVTNGH